MSYWVRGRDRESGAPADLFSDAETEESARAQAEEQGIEVDVIERAEPETPTPQDALLPYPRRLGWLAVTFLTMGQFISVCLCFLALWNAATCIFSAAAKPTFLGIVDAPNLRLLLLIALCTFAYNAAMFIVFSTVKNSGRQ